MRLAVISLLVAGVLAAIPAASAQRDTISIVGSSTVYPFATVAAERFGRTSRFRIPKIESTGTGGGFKLFCEGVGLEHPDFTNASRGMKRSEYLICKANGVDRVVEIKLGYDGIVLANSAESPRLTVTLEELYLALAKYVPDPATGTRLVLNPHQRWSDVAPHLPDQRIEVLGPPPTSGTRDAWVELAMEGGCQKLPLLAEMRVDDPDGYEAVCRGMREDGLFVEAGENDNPTAFGIFGYSFLEQNADRVQGAAIGGVEPTFEAISDRSYPVSRSLFMYLKAQHLGVIPGIDEFVEELTSLNAMGPEGYLAMRGLIPLPVDEYRAMLERVRTRTPVAF